MCFHSKGSHQQRRQTDRQQDGRKLSLAVLQTEELIFRKYKELPNLNKYTLMKPVNH